MTKEIRPTLLCLDDEESILRALHRNLRSAEYEVLCVTDPEEALEWVRRKKIHVMISDYRLIVTTGVEVLREVGKIDPTVVRIILSGYAGQNAIDEALRSGDVHLFFSKPWDPQALKREVRACFDRLRANG